MDISRTGVKNGTKIFAGEPSLAIPRHRIKRADDAFFDCGKPFKPRPPIFRLVAVLARLGDVRRPASGNRHGNGIGTNCLAGPERIVLRVAGPERILSCSPTPEAMTTNLIHPRAFRPAVSLNFAISFVPGS